METMEESFLNYLLMPGMNCGKNYLTITGKYLLVNIKLGMYSTAFQKHNQDFIKHEY